MKQWHQLIVDVCSGTIDIRAKTSHMIEVVSIVCVLRGSFGNNLILNCSFKVHLLKELIMSIFPPYNVTLKALSSRSPAVYFKRTIF